MFVLDVVDTDEAGPLRAAGVVVDLRDTVMRTDADRERLAGEILAAHLPG